MLGRKAKSGHVSTESAMPVASQLYEMIASRAYELYELRGAGAGDELADWLTAEREILTDTSAPKVEAPANTGKGAPAPSPESGKKSSKLVSMGGSRKKADSTVARSSTKPKGAHP